MTILLGYEIGTGKAIRIPLRHLAVTGQTQLSGKTSTLEALITRSGLRAIAFVTKRGEGGFQQYRNIPPYFSERTDWQSVEAMLVATMREKMRYERPSIIGVCKGAKTFQDIHANIRQQLQSARGPQRVYEVLNAYLEIVLPQIEALPYSETLKLHAGINVMDLRKYTSELQALVIRSVLDWVYEHGQKTIAIIPEAWEFIPQGMKDSPVMSAAERLIRKGASTETFVWLDSQDLAGVNKKIVKQVGVYILGVQREENEVKRTLAHIFGVAKPKLEDIRALGIGQFYVCFDQTLAKVYVQPIWADEMEAKVAAMSGGGIIQPPARRRHFKTEDTESAEETIVEQAGQ